MSRAISSQRPNCANLAHAGTNAYETVGNRTVKFELILNNCMRSNPEKSDPTGEKPGATIYVPRLRQVLRRPIGEHFWAHEPPTHARPHHHRSTGRPNLLQNMRHSGRVTNQSKIYFLPKKKLLKKSLKIMVASLKYSTSSIV